MHKAELTEIRQQVQAELDTCLTFWLQHGRDDAHGGVLTCLDRQGAVYSTDKSVWMQGRCAWLFSHLCRVYGTRDAWLDMAESCLAFLEDHCINRGKGNRLYFTVTQDGRPLRQRRYCFSEAFYAMANAEYHALTGSAPALERARKAYELVWQLNNGLIEDPAGIGPKTLPATRQGRALANPMIYLNLSSLMQQCDPAGAGLYAQRADRCAQDVLDYHVQPALNATLETVGMEGQFWGEISAGRVVNPGHAIECAWFMLEHARYRQDDALYRQGVQIFDDAYRLGWDNTYGGLLYYVDVLGHPPEAYEHDMKLWWPHNELLIASLMIYRDTGREEYLDIFKETWRYAMEVFRDAEYPEWYGYLRRDGKPTEPPAKGSTFKGPFHLPRMLAKVDGMLGGLLA